MELKQPTTYSEQINKLIERQCSVKDKVTACDVLSTINYYRLSAYFLPFKGSDDKYHPNTSFETVLKIYAFDKHVRVLLFSFIEEVEILLRTKFSYYFAHKYGALGYLSREHFNLRHNHDKFLNDIDVEISRNAKVPFVKHHIDKYERRFPLWVIIELFSLGALSRFYSDLLTLDKKALAKELGLYYIDVVSWLHCLTILRNTCAHYSRLYYRIFPMLPTTPSGGVCLGGSLFDYVTVLKYLFQDANRWNGVFVLQLQALIDAYSNAIELKHIGFPDDWSDQLRK